MVVTEALARGIPVLATGWAGCRRRSGTRPTATVPGLLVPPDDPAALAGALRRWLGDADAARPAAARRPAAGGDDAGPAGTATAAELAGVLDGCVSPESRDRRPRPCYAPDWLALRERADAAARAPTGRCSTPLRARLTGGHAGRLVIHDLGCGTGSMGRWLAPRLAGPQHWVLHDRDPDLLALAAAMPRTAADGSAGHASTPGAATSTRLTAADLAGASLVTASALLDMLTAEEIDALAAACAGAGCPALLTLSVAGGSSSTRPTRWTPRSRTRSTPTSADVDGRRLLGPDAVAVAAEAFARHGATVRRTPARGGSAPAEPR